MDKNTIIAIVLSMLVVVVSFFVQTKYFIPRQQQRIEEQQRLIQEESEREAARAREEKEQVSAAIQSELGEEEEAQPEIAREYEISTAKVRVVFTNRGGDIVSYKLLEHKDKDSGDGVEMAMGVTPSNRAFSLSFGNADTTALDDIFKVSQKDSRTILFYRDYEVRDSAGVPRKFTVGKRYSFSEDEYVFKLDVSVVSSEGAGLDLSGVSYTLRTSPQIGPKFDKSNRYDDRQYLSFNGSKRVRKSISDKTYSGAYEWTGIAGKYFTMLVRPSEPGTMVSQVKTVSKSQSGSPLSQAFLSRAAVSERSVNDTYYVYVGPRSESELIKYNDQGKNSWGLSNMRFNQALQTSGFFSLFEVILKWCLEKIYAVMETLFSLRNWGVAIIILTVLLKVVLFPLNKKSAMGSLKMQEIQPRMKELQEKYKDDQQKLGLEMQKLYKEAGYNPMSGCLPMVAQMFILLALYNVFNNYFEFRGASFISGWIDDLSAGDSIMTFGAQIPFVTAFTSGHLRLLPFIYTGSQLLNGKITQYGNAGAAGASQTQMKFMMYGMPVMFFFLFYNVPSGLLLYWTTSNILQIGQQLIINRVMRKKREELASRAPAVNKNVLKFKGGKKKTR